MSNVQPAAPKPHWVALVEKGIWPIELIAVAAFVPWDRVLPNPSPSPDDPAPPGPAPVVDRDLQALADVVKDAESSDRQALADFLDAVAEQFSRTQSADLSVVNEFLSSADTYRFQGTDLIGAFSGFTAVRDRLLTREVGVESRLLSAAELKKLSALFASMANVVRG